MAATMKVIRDRSNQHSLHPSLLEFRRIEGRRNPVTIMPRPVPPVTIPTALPILPFSNHAIDKVAMEILVPAPPAPIAKIEEKRGKNVEDLLMKSIEKAPHKREAITTLFGPNRVVSMPLRREKRR
jgi:hypothetical protein